MASDCSTAVSSDKVFQIMTNKFKVSLLFICWCLCFNLFYGVHNAALLEGKVIVVTGADVGKGIAMEAARQGVKVIVNDLG